MDDDVIKILYEPDEFISLRDAIDMSIHELGVNSNVTRILQAVLEVMVSGRYEYDDVALNELEQLCR